MNKDEMTSWLYGLSVHGIKLGLTNITELLDRLGNPQGSFRTIHVAGTDGKGSTCAMIESILRCSGVRTGLYTSPHILDFNERMRVCGIPITDGELEHYVSIVKDHVEDMRSHGMQCTFFEATTAIAFQFFKDKGVEYAVVEVGMGGRFDATNIIHPEVSVITNISMEHTEYLGDTLEKIAYEKAGIIKEGVPVITSNEGVALDVIKDVASSLHTEVTVTDEISIISLDEKRTRATYKGREYDIDLVGRYQAKNAALAIEAVSSLGSFRIAEGLGSVYWPCRLQKMDDLPIIVDVSHTAAGSKAAFDAVKEIYGRVTVVFGILGDKDMDSISRNLSMIASKIIVTSPHSDRAAKRDVVMDAIMRYNHDVRYVEDIDEAIDTAMSVRGDGNVLITGSLFMAEGAMRWLRRTSVGY